MVSQDITSVYALLPYALLPTLVPYTCNTYSLVYIMKSIHDLRTLYHQPLNIGFLLSRPVHRQFCCWSRDAAIQKLTSVDSNIYPRHYMHALTLSQLAFTTLLFVM